MLEEIESKELNNKKTSKTIIAIIGVVAIIVVLLFVTRFIAKNKQVEEYANITNEMLTNAQVADELYINIINDWYDALVDESEIDDNDSKEKPNFDIDKYLLSSSVKNKRKEIKSSAEQIKEEVDNINNKFKKLNELDEGVKKLYTSYARFTSLQLNLKDYNEFFDIYTDEKNSFIDRYNKVYSLFDK